jgi:hypothetical protein
MLLFRLVRLWEEHWERSLEGSWPSTRRAYIVHSLPFAISHYILPMKFRWRGVFFFFSALATTIGIIGWLAIDSDAQHETSKDKRVDWIGAFFVTTGLVFIIFALSDASTSGWGSPLIISLLVLGAVFIGLFLGWEHYLISRTSYPPLMALDIWTRARGQFAAMQAVAFFEWCCFTTLTLWGMLYYQNYLHLDPMSTMLRFLPMEITGFICTVLVAILVGRISGAYLLSEISILSGTYNLY